MKSQLGRGTEFMFYVKEKERPNVREEENKDSFVNFNPSFTQN